MIYVANRNDERAAATSTQAISSGTARGCRSFDESVAMQNTASRNTTKTFIEGSDAYCSLRCSLREEMDQALRHGARRTVQDNP